MAELILTEEEKAAALWSDLSDEALGKLVKKKIAFLTAAADQLDRTTTFAAALLLCCSAAENNSKSMMFDIEGVTQGHREFGDWTVKVEKRTHPPEIKPGSLVVYMGATYEAVGYGDMPGTFDIVLYPDCMAGDRFRNVPASALKLTSKSGE
ncbi:hypothetical protein [Zoogloea sp.]|uniref:hypothetical protein n=1 Tax=Zoogloea sp. TaxID=49181 RepID=UPI001AD3B703|nr:hypothetical protein [Zoogloea sp.]MBN8283429.1 hypothetical protein [Zoogloea sp.]